MHPQYNPEETDPAPQALGLGLSYSHNSSSHPVDNASYVEFSPHGSYVKLRFKNLLTDRERIAAAKERARKKVEASRYYRLIGPLLPGQSPFIPRPVRSRISGFSRSSQQRLRVLTNSLPDTLPLPLFITLTYPNEWPAKAAKWKKDLNVVLQLLGDNFDKPVIIWKLEPQERGAPHFHLAVYTEMWMGPKWLARKWYRIVGSGDRRHLRAGTGVERARTRRGSLSYIAKYIGKAFTAPPGWEHVGRYWGVRNRPKGMLKRVWVPQRSAYLIRRALWRFRASHNRRYKRTKYRGDAQGTSGYLSGGQTERLIAYALGHGVGTILPP